MQLLLNGKHLPQAIAGRNVLRRNTGLLPFLYLLAGLMIIFAAAAPVQAASSSLTIRKETNPGGTPDSFDFGIYATEGVFSDNFALTGGSSKQFSLEPGKYRVTEYPPFGAWSLTDIYCSKAVAGKDVPADGHYGWVEIDLADGDNVTCTYTNLSLTLPTSTPSPTPTPAPTPTPVDAKLMIRKVTDPSGDPESYPIRLFNDWGFQFNYSLKDGEYKYITLQPGRYAVEESVTVAGRALASIRCNKPGVEYEISAAGDYGIVKITLAAGDDVSCTFTNTMLTAPEATKTAPDVTTADAKLTILKETNPAGNPQSFEFGIWFFEDWFGHRVFVKDFVLRDGESETIALQPGNYAVAERIPAAGWVVTRISCNKDGANYYYSDKADAGMLDIGLASGDDVTCVFTNHTAAPGSISVIKRAQPEGAAEAFNFSGSLAGLDGVTLRDGEMNVIQVAAADSDSLLPDSQAWMIMEAAPEGWKLQEILCREVVSSWAERTGFLKNVPDGQVLIQPNLREGETYQGIALCEFISIQESVKDKSPFPIRRR